MIPVDYDLILATGTRLVLKYEVESFVDNAATAQSQSAVLQRILPGSVMPYRICCVHYSMLKMKATVTACVGTG